ncbi:MAG: hypothetical protein V4613_12145 [Bacteroidota bacterium]
MEKIKFTYNLHEATERLIDFSKTMCFNEFSNNCKYIITPNARKVGVRDEHLRATEKKVLKSWNKYEGKLLEAEQVVELLHHDNKVPVWINASVYEAQPNLTIIDLLCSRRLRDESELMHPEHSPFHLQVLMPPDSLKVDVDGKFDVNWRKRQNNKSQPMIKQISTYYWFFIAIIQVIIICTRLVAYGGYLWNIIVLGCILGLIYNRIVRHKILFRTEMAISGLIGIYSSIRFLSQVVSSANDMVALISFTIAIMSFLMFFHIWRKDIQE